MFSTLLFAILSLSQLSLADPSPGCRKKGDSRDSPMLVNALDFEKRPVLMHFPSKYKLTRPSPLILVFHDAQMPLQNMKKSTGLAAADQFKDYAMLAFPSALQNVWITDPLSDFEPKPKDAPDPKDDIKFSVGLLDHLLNTYCIDTRRIFAAGQGTGGGIIHHLACEAESSKRIAAFAAISGGFFKPQEGNNTIWNKDCHVSRKPVPILEIHGQLDDKYPLNPDEDSPDSSVYAAKEWVTDWAERNGCGKPKGTPTPGKQQKTSLLTELENGQKSETVTYGGGATKISYRCGKDPERDNADFTAEESDWKKISVLHYGLRGYKHGWPRTVLTRHEEVEVAGVMVKTSGKSYFDTSSVMLQFFRSHPLPKDENGQKQAADQHHKETSTKGGDFGTSKKEEL